MEVSCIIPTFNNSEAQLESAIFSVLNSKYPIAEIVLIDDGSDSDSAEKVAGRFRDIHSANIVFLKQKNQGPSSARNTGVSISSCEWIAFLDADDSLTDEGLRHKIQLLSQVNADSLGGVFGSYIWSTTGEKQKLTITEGSACQDNVGVEGKVPGGVPAYLMKKKAFLSVGGFDENLTHNEDIDLIVRMMSRGYEFYGINEPGFVRVVHELSHSRRDRLEALSGSRAFLRKAYRERLLSRKEIYRRFFLNYLVSGKIMAKKIINFFLFRC